MRFSGLESREEAEEAGGKLSSAAIWAAVLADHVLLAGAPLKVPHVAVAMVDAQQAPPAAARAALVV